MVLFSGPFPPLSDKRQIERGRAEGGYPFLESISFSLFFLCFFFIFSFFFSFFFFWNHLFFIYFFIYFFFFFVIASRLIWNHCAMRLLDFHGQFDFLIFFFSSLPLSFMIPPLVSQLVFTYFALPSNKTEKSLPFFLSFFLSFLFFFFFFFHSFIIFSIYFFLLWPSKPIANLFFWESLSHLFPLLSLPSSFIDISHLFLHHLSVPSSFLDLPFPPEGLTLQRKRMRIPLLPLLLSLPLSLHLTFGAVYGVMDDTDRNIYDFQTTTSSVTVSGLPPVISSVADIRVYVNIGHTYPSDLIVKLTSPDGMVRTLINRNFRSCDHHIHDLTLRQSASNSVTNSLQCESCYWVFIVYTCDDVDYSALRPVDTLHGFRGQNPNGQWTLSVEDVANQDQGILYRFILYLEGNFHRFCLYYTTQKERKNKNKKNFIDACIGISNPCQNGGTCEAYGTSAGEYTCACTAAWEGATCETDVNECDDSPCHPQASCSNSPGSFSCTCNSGFSGDGFTCTGSFSPSASPSLSLPFL